MFLYIAVESQDSGDQNWASMTILFVKGCYIKISYNIDIVSQWAIFCTRSNKFQFLLIYLYLYLRLYRVFFVAYIAYKYFWMVNNGSLWKQVIEQIIKIVTCMNLIYTIDISAKSEIWCASINFMFFLIKNMLFVALVLFYAYLELTSAKYNSYDFWHNLTVCAE